MNRPLLSLVLAGALALGACASKPSTTPQTPPPDTSPIKKE
jgi:hypothetical protein